MSWLLLSSAVVTLYFDLLCCFLNGMCLLICLYVLVLGVMFLVLQFMEFVLLVSSFTGFIIEMSFYLTTTVHGAHVLLGLCS